MVTKRRSDYAPTVRPRTMREQGQRRLTPGYLDDISDTKFRYASGVTSSSRTTVVTPSQGKRIRLVRLTMTQTGSDGVHIAEVYLGTGTNISTNATKAIALVRIADLSAGSTPAWTRGAGPVGLKNEVLSYRFTVAPSTNHQIIVEYTEER